MGGEQMTGFSDKIQWHPGFYGAAELELSANKAELEFEREYNLSKEPLRVDLLIVKKRKEVQIQNEIGRIFKKFNVLEYKSPDDSMSIDDYYKTVGYACIYKGLGTTVDAVPAEELTVSLFRETYPREMMEALKRLGACIEETFPGIYYVHGNTLFDTQIVVTGQLSRETHSSLRVLSKNAQEDDIKRFLMTSQKLTIPGDKHNADAVLQVSISANGRIYNRVKEELNMCEALRELMKDEIAYDVEQGMAKGIEKGIAEGEKKQAMTTAYTLSDMGMTIDVIAKAIHYSVETVTQWLENRPADTAQG
jgi:CRP-like cAMP-binding protein